MNDSIKLNLKKPQYNLARHVFLQSFAGSLLVGFYTTKDGFFKSLLSPAHLINFGLNFILMIILSIGLGIISAYLDKISPWKRKTTQRYLLQFVFGIIVPALISLVVITLIFRYLFGSDLLQPSYLLRDYVMLVATIVGINVFHYYQYHKHSYTFPKKLIHFIVESLENRKVDSEKNYAEQYDSTSEKLLYHMMDEEFRTKYNIFGSDIPLLSNQIGMFFVKSHSNLRNKIFVKLLDGREALLMDYDSLNDIAAQYEYLFIRIGRKWVVNRYTVMSSRKVDYRTYEIHLNIPDTEPIMVTLNTYEMLKPLIGLRK